MYQFPRFAWINGLLPRGRHMRDGAPYPVCVVVDTDDTNRHAGPSGRPAAFRV